MAKGKPTFGEIILIGLALFLGALFWGLITGDLKRETPEQRAAARAARVAAAPVVREAPKTPPPDSQWRDTALAEIRGEKKVVEAMFTMPSILWVSMRDDGSPRDGYAQYLCLVLKGEGMPGGHSVIIRIWDAYAMARDELRPIGRHRCVKG